MTVIFLVMCMVFLRFRNELTINRVFFLELGSNNNGLIHFIADNNTCSCFS